VLGSESDTTRLCGEHVTPCHEHGVAALGSHDGSTGDGAAPGSSDSSALPSGDSAAAVPTDSTRSAAAAATTEKSRARRRWCAIIIDETASRSRRTRRGNREKGNDLLFPSNRERGRPARRGHGMRCARSLATGKSKSKEKQDAMVGEACGEVGSVARSLSGSAAAVVACAAPNKHMEEAVTGVSLQLRLPPHFSYAAWPARRWMGLWRSTNWLLKPLIWAALNPGRFGLICGSWEME